MDALSESNRQCAVDFFQSFQKRLIKRLEEVDGKGNFEMKPWERSQGGGGQMAVLRSEVIEKSGVNCSTVFGDSYPSLENDHKDQPFYAAGVSSITHMMNPFAPIGHMNVRLIEVGDGFWFGGGADLTPFHKYQEDTDAFHDSLRDACNLYGADAYKKFSKWCDEYFYIKHRNSVRGVGGIFFDYLKGAFDEVFPFVKATAEAYLTAYPDILDRRKNTDYTDQDKDEQLYWRGRYAEFNLVYDRGTKFGLLTGGNTEAIFVSLPPVVKW